MSDDTLVNVNRDLENAKKAAYDLGVSTGIDPFMTLSFMALPVIPSLRITTRGVFDVRANSALRLIPAPRFAGTYIRAKKEALAGFLFLLTASVHNPGS